MVTGTTKSGFEFEADEKILDNMELVDALNDLSGGNTLAMSTVIKKLFDDDTRQRLYDHVRTEDGRVPTSAIDKEVTEIMGFFSKGKKS